jgi:8-oxo-dGTP pyrophosphatase MutT (NUDIX family)
MEKWDLYNENRQPLNRTLIRGEQKNPGEHHIVVEVWTVNSNRDILVTLRDPNKLEYPGKWENTGGSVLSGETSKQGAIRELFEETGISATENELSLLGTYKEHSAFVDIYLLRRDVEIEDLTMQEGETVDAKWVSFKELEDMINDLSLALPTAHRLRHVREEFDKHCTA